MCSTNCTIRRQLISDKSLLCTCAPMHLTFDCILQDRLLAVNISVAVPCDGYDTNVLHRPFLFCVHWPLQSQKNVKDTCPAYGRHWLCLRVWIVAPMQGGREGGREGCWLAEGDLQNKLLDEGKTHIHKIHIQTSRLLDWLGLGAKLVKTENFGDFWDQKQTWLEQI